MAAIQEMLSLHLSVDILNKAFYKDLTFYLHFRDKYFLCHFWGQTQILIKQQFKDFGDTQTLVKLYF